MPRLVHWEGPVGRRPRGKPTTQGRDYIYSSAWESSEITQKRLEKCWWEAPGLEHSLLPDPGLEDANAIKCYRYARGTLNDVISSGFSKPS